MTPIEKQFFEFVEALKKAPTQDGIEFLRVISIYIGNSPNGTYEDLTKMAKSIAATAQARVSK